MYMETTRTGRGPNTSSIKDLEDTGSLDGSGNGGSRSNGNNGGSIVGDLSLEGRGNGSNESSVQIGDNVMSGSDVKSNRNVAIQAGRKRGAPKAEVEYGLSRNFLINQFRKGRISKRDICDAHPELLRAARNIGKRSSVIDCPVCEVSKVSYVTYVFGSGLPSGGRCVINTGEILKFKSHTRNGHLACYVIEVCPNCGWNHLAKIFWA